MSQMHSFKEMYDKLPGKLSKNMSKNLSVSIAFVCILHLANEKVKFCLYSVQGHGPSGVSLVTIANSEQGYCKVLPS